MKPEELRKTLVAVDSLLSLLVHRHGKFMEEIGEREEATKLYEQCRYFASKLDIISLPRI